MNAVMSVTDSHAHFTIKYSIHHCISIRWPSEFHNFTENPTLVTAPPTTSLHKLLTEKEKELVPSVTYDPTLYI